MHSSVQKPPEGLTVEIQLSWLLQYKHPTLQTADKELHSKKAGLTSIPRLSVGEKAVRI